MTPALGMVETSSIARGVIVVDAMVKKAPIRVLQNHPISPGKHLVVVVGGVAEVDEALQAGLAVAGATVVDRLFLPQAHDQLAPLLAGGRGVAIIESVAIFETYSATATVLAADAAAKAADVTLLDMRLGQGLGGKGFFTMTGALEAIEAAAAAGGGAIDAALLVGVEIIARPHEDLQVRLMW
jgi:bacterial microcompartment shell protein